MSDQESKKPAGKPAAKANKPKQKKSGKPASTKQERSPAWWVFTHSSATFVASAKELSERLTHTFGVGVTISHFERMLLEFSSLSSDQRKLVKLDKAIMDLYQTYLKDRETRDAERQSFRARKDVEAVGSTLEKVQALLGAAPDDGKAAQ